MITICVLLALWAGAEHTDWTTIQLIWDPVTEDVNGNPEVVVSAYVGFFSVDDEDVCIRGWAIPNTPAGVEIKNFQSKMPPGNYYIKVRVYDQAGNVSAWSEVCRDSEDNSVSVFAVPATPPEAPMNVRVIIKQG